jgi:ATP-dependent helicase/nuclease subunit B
MFPLPHNASEIYLQNGYNKEKKVRSIMSLRFIYGRCGTGKSEYCLENIKKNIENNTENNYIEKQVLLVPEQYSFQAEKNMLSVVGASGILNSEVLSFKRLCNRVFNEVGGITRRRINDCGKNMIIYSVIETVKDKLKIFKETSSKQGFIDIISDSIKEFKRYNISKEILLETIEGVEDTELKLKLYDLAVIYEEFEKELHKTYIDSEDELTFLAQKLDACSSYDGAEIWIDEFTTFTPQQYNIIEKLMKKCRRVNVTLCCDANNNLDSLDVFSVLKNTERKLLKIASDNNVAYDKPINLNSECPIRFRDSNELKHIEKYYFSYPYKIYNDEVRNLKLYKALNSYEEIQYVASEILKEVRDNNLRFKDIGVVCRNLENYEEIVTAIFNEYAIPHFLDRKMDITSNPLVILINSVFDIFTKGWSYESVFKYLKTGLTNINKNDIDIIENYVLANGIRGNKWINDDMWTYKLNYSFDEAEITPYENSIINRVNEIRETITVPLLNFRDKVKSSGSRNTVRNISKALYELLIDLDALDKIQNWSEELKEENPLKSTEYRQIVDIVIDTLDQIVDVMGDENLTFDEYVKILSVGLEKEDVGSIPLSLDEVLVGDVARIKGYKVKTLYIIGVNDGIFPASSRDEGILSDKDRVFLKERGVELAADTKTAAFEEQYLIYSTLGIPSQKLVLTYPVADFEGKTLRPSVIISRIKKIFPKLIEESDLSIYEKNESILNRITKPIPTFNNLVSALRRDFEGEEIEDMWWSVYKWFDNNEEWKFKASRIFKGLEYSNVTSKIEREKLKEIYGAPFYFSVSRVESYARCPFAYFVQFGLRAKERKIYEFSSPDFGSFMHGILDRFSDKVKQENLTWQELDNSWTKSTINGIVEDEVNSKSNSILKSSARFNNITDKLKRIITRSVTVISNQMKNSSFKPLANELVFGKGGTIPPVKLTLPSGEDVFFRGRIDRVDGLSEDGETFFRIIDYKTGKKSFNLSEVYYGLQLQLLVYLEALISNAKLFVGQKALPGAILYFRIDDPMIKGNSGMSDSEIEAKIMEKLKMDGLILNDIKIIKEMDTTLDKEGKSLIIPISLKKDGDIKKSDAVITLEQFEILRDYVRKILTNLCGEMLSGNIEIKPCKEAKDPACKYCDFISICQFDPSIQGNKYKQVIKKKNDEVWSLMKGEEINE